MIKQSKRLMTEKGDRRVDREKTTFGTGKGKVVAEPSMHRQSVKVVPTCEAQSK